MQCFCGNSSVGRASASQAEGRGFESRFPLKRIPAMRASQQRCLFLCVAPPGSLLPGRKTHKKNRGSKAALPSFCISFCKRPRGEREGNAQPAGRAQSRQREGNAGGQIPRMRGMRSPPSLHLSQNCAANGLELHKLAFIDELCAINDISLHKVVPLRRILSEFRHSLILPF